MEMFGQSYLYVKWLPMEMNDDIYNIDWELYLIMSFMDLILIFGDTLYRWSGIIRQFPRDRIHD